MRIHRIFVCSLALGAVSLAACQPSGETAARPGASVAADGGGERGEPVTVDGAALDGDVVVSTNEPFWQARIEGDTVLVTGVDGPARRFANASSSMTADGRRIAARDQAGDVVLIVRRMRCEDDMSGARFPLTALLTLDGDGPHHGCARPASMPPPRPSDVAARSLPADAERRRRPVSARAGGANSVDSMASRGASAGPHAR
ncbi:hypothetical protein MNO14_09355 [Luteimonas sp. S4-F44]|uniref:hypothetical protein n=1 Tax=Luteimonas sp. S4-F44 TaxID=2925842 RepID=UPI001F5343D2|nr:hypothetical protein [Luteimonas sp. S4-F44]UNK41192.1 hypothetical protein MNO14_09355 [Luteimonas sp. S4-F44]